MRRTQELPVREVIVTPSGRTVLDFGQNLVGWVRFTVDGDGRHASSRCVTPRCWNTASSARGRCGMPKRRTDTPLRGDGPETWEPAFTFHGFRYVEVDGWPTAELDPGAFTAVVIHSDFERTGTFTCSTNCSSGCTRTSCGACAATSSTSPPTARNATSGSDGPATSRCSPRPRPSSSTSRASSPTGSTISRAEQTRRRLGATRRAVRTRPAHVQFVAGGVGRRGHRAAVDSVRALRRHRAAGPPARQHARLGRLRPGQGRRRAACGQREFQLGDWLDPEAPPDEPLRGRDRRGARRDRVLRPLGAARRAMPQPSLGRDDLAGEYGDLARRLRRAFRDEYATPSGRAQLRLRHRLLARDRVRPLRRPAPPGARGVADRRARVATAVPDLDRVRGHARRAPCADSGGDTHDGLPTPDARPRAHRGSTR